MTSFRGVRLPDVSTLKGKPIDKRIAVLKKYAQKVEHQTREGITEEEALEFVRYWRPAFGSLKLLRSQPGPDGRRDLKVVVDNHTCQHCRFAFDEKDLKSICTEGIMCPKCGELVSKHVAAPPCGGGPTQEPQSGEQK